MHNSDYDKAERFLSDACEAAGVTADCLVDFIRDARGDFTRYGPPPPLAATDIKQRARGLLADLERAQGGAELDHQEKVKEACGIGLLTEDGRQLGSNVVALTSVLSTLRWLLKEEGQKPDDREKTKGRKIPEKGPDHGGETEEGDC